MASTSSAETFPLLDLPREIRNKIYRVALCTFGPRPDTVNPPPDASTNPTFLNMLARVDHEIDTSILLACKQVHREAYDVMVKTNQFVRVTTSGGFPLRILLNHLQVPVVTEDEEYVDKFKGYVLSVSLAFPKEVGKAFQDSPLSIEPCSLMLLGRDMDVFCDILMDGDTYLAGFGMKAALKIAVAPGNVLTDSTYKDPLTDYFSAKTQQVLLQPFRKRLRGFKKVKMRGFVDQSIARAVEQELAQDAALDPEAVLAKYQSSKDEGQNLYKSKLSDAASLKWMDAALEIEQLLESSSWAGLTQKGGVPFVSRLAEIYFLMKLNVAHINLVNMERHMPWAEIMAEDALKMASRSLTKGYWLPDFRWQPTDVHKAKLRYRHALFLRLEGNPQNITLAMSVISSAHRLLPDDAGIARERDMILAWSDSMR